MIGLSGASNSHVVMVAKRPAGNLLGSSPTNRWLECCPLSRYSLPLPRSTPLSHSTPKKVPFSRCRPRKCILASLSGRSPSTGVMAANSEASSWVNGTLSTWVFAIIFRPPGTICSASARCCARLGGLGNPIQFALDPVQQFGLPASNHLLRLPTFFHSFVVILLSLLRYHAAQVLRPCA